MPGNIKEDWEVFAYYAATNRMGTDSVYLARVNPAKLSAALDHASEMIDNDSWQKNTLYILDKPVVSEVVSKLIGNSDLVACIDGYYVLMPGWKQLKAGFNMIEEVKLDELLSPAPIGKGLFMHLGGNGLPYLLTGWSHPEQWGIWSDGPKAGLVLPVRAHLGDDVVITLQCHGFSEKGHKQVVEVWINEVKTATMTFDETRNDDSYSFRVPNAAMTPGERQDLRIVFKIRQPLRPKDLEISDDTRSLGIALVGLIIDVSSNQ